MKILIVGGGIAGCACAALLQKYETAEVTLIDHAPEFKNIGYIIGLWGTGRKVLKELGIDGYIASKGYKYDSDTIFDEKGRLIKIATLEDFKELETIVIKRNDVHQSLFELLDGVHVRFNTTCANIEQEDEKVHVTLSDKTRETFDLVIGADGIGSAVREMVFGKEFLHRYGWRIWMWWFPRGQQQSNNAISYYGNGRVCSVLPYLDTPVAILVTKNSAKNTHDNSVRPESLFVDFCKEVRDIVQTAPDSKDLYNDNISYVEMPVWHKGRVVLIGDAQHAASPVIGMGASMAMEDAFVLAEELRLRTNIDESLLAFAKRREKRIRRFRRIVNQMNRWTMADGVLAYVRNKILAFIPTRYFMNVLRRFIETEV